MLGFFGRRQRLAVNTGRVEAADARLSARQHADRVDRSLVARLRLLRGLDPMHPVDFGESRCAIPSLLRGFAGLEKFPERGRKVRFGRMRQCRQHEGRRIAGSELLVFDDAGGNTEPMTELPVRLHHRFE